MDLIFEMKEERKTHQQYMRDYARSHCDFQKVASIMPPDAHGHNSSVLRTSAWRAGDLDELRRPSKTKTKTKKKKNKKKNKKGNDVARKKKAVFAKPRPVKKITKLVRPIVKSTIRKKVPKVIKIKREST